MNLKIVTKLTILLSLITFLLLPLSIQARPSPPVLTTEVSGSGSVNPSGGIYKKNNMVSIEAIADDGWIFDHWEGDLTGTVNPTYIRMTSDKLAIAVFLISLFRSC